MANVLVTGASGFLGTAVIARLLTAGHYTVGLDPVPAPDAARRHVTDDLSDRRRLDELLRAERITHVIHCGGVSGPMVLADDPARVMQINVGGQPQSADGVARKREDVYLLLVRVGRW